MQKRIAPPRGGDGDDRMPELVVDKEWKSPAPLDRRIASVWMRTPANDVTDGYDLMVSASFGRDRVTLKGGGFEIEVDFSLKTADIELAFLGCTKTMIDDGTGAPEFRTSVKDVSTEETNSRYSAGGQLSGGPAGASGKAHAAGQYEHSAKQQKTTQREMISKAAYRLIGDDMIMVEPVTGEYLNGSLIRDLCRWRVKPNDRSRPSSVIATVKVREGWIRFENEKVLESPVGYVKRLRDILLTSRDRRQKDLFHVLLAHLAQIGLRRHQDGKLATIATHILRVRPNDDRAIGLPSGPARQQITIDSRPLEVYLDAPEGMEAETLRALGVDPELIPGTPIVDDNNGVKAERARGFVPDSAPPHAAETFAIIYERELVSKDELPYPNTLKDLRALGVVVSAGDKLALNVPRGLNAEMVFRRAVSQMDCIRVARSLLSAAPTTTSIQIAEAVASALNKHWPTIGTKRRNGNAIVRWAVWLEPHLMDTASSSDAAARVAYAIDEQESKKGRSDALQRMNEHKLRRLVAQGLTTTEIAKQLNVSQTAIMNWLGKLGLKTVRARKPKPPAPPGI